MQGDISKSLIPTAVIQQRIGSIFPNSIILDNQLRFVSVSQNILDAIGYTREELFNKSISVLSRTSDLAKVLNEKLAHGYFADEQFEVQRKDGSSISYLASGFYMGLISEVNGLIILRMINQDEMAAVYDRMELRASEIDRFVYVSAHALRGPLATMKGLINLTKSYSNSSDINFLVDQLEQFANKLDDQLHKLIYFAESDKGYEATSHSISVNEIVRSLRAAIRDSHTDHVVNFSCIAANHSLLLENGEVLHALLRNIVLFFCQQKKVAGNKIELDVHSGSDTVELVVQATGFVPTDLLRAKLSAMNFSYSEILNHPELINFYAAKKIAFRLRADMQFVLTGSDDVTVLVTVPKNRPLKDSQ
jgi:PAS domain S-box-containing protein